MWGLAGGQIVHIAQEKIANLSPAALFLFGLNGIPLFPDSIISSTA